MTIGLYDIDLWHSPRKFPNLELMKIYNYYTLKNNKVIMMTPGMDEGRFDKIIYFKETPFTNLPNSLCITGEKKSYFGYGFYRKSKLLPEPIQNTAPSFLPYDLYFHKLTNKNSYEQMRRASIVRLRTNDLTGVQNINKQYYIVDYEPIQCENLFDFISARPNNKFNFFYSLTFYNKQDVLKFEPLKKQITNRFHIEFKYDTAFFESHLGTDYVYYGSRFKNESENDYWFRIIKQILIIKREKKPISLLYLEDDDFTKSLHQWLTSSTNKSYYNFYQNTSNEKFVNQANQKIRMLLKQNPITFNSKNLDLWEKV